MWNKLYLAVLGLSIAVMVFLTYYSWSWLQSIGIPAGAVAGYEYHSDIAWWALWLSSLTLFVLGNAVLWVHRNAWAMWATFLFFAVFVVLRYFWLDQAFFHFKKDNGLFDGSFSVGPFFAVFLIILAGVIVFSNQFLVTRLRAKTYPEAERSELDSVGE